MGFWSGVGSVLSSIWNSALEDGEKMQAEVNEISHLSDKELVEMVKNSSLKIEQRKAAKYILRKHGVIKDD